MRVVSKFIVLHLSNPSYNLAGVQEKSRLVVAIPPPHPPHSGSELCASLHIPPPSQGRLAASRLKSEHVEVEHSARRDVCEREPFLRRAADQGSRLGGQSGFVGRWPGWRRVVLIVDVAPVM